MSKIYYIMGKSATGKDTIFRRLFESVSGLKRLVPYTTRPMRSGETEGVDYHFVSDGKISEFEELGRVVEVRRYNTVKGIWTYATIDDGSFNADNDIYIGIGTLDSYGAIKSYFSNVVPICIEVDNYTRLIRAIERERLQDNPNFDEVCRRYLADEIDFSADRLKQFGISRSYRNDDLDRCIEEIKEEICR